MKYLYTQKSLQTLPSGKNLSYFSYPPGSALFVYHFLESVGYSEHHIVLGQELLIFSALSGLYSGIQKPKNWLSPLVITGFIMMIALWDAEIHIYNLLGDVLIFLTFLGVFIGMHSFQRSIGSLIFFFVITVMFLSLIKTSVLFFVGVLVCYYLNQFLTICPKKRFVLGVILSVALTFVPRYLWTVYINYHFSDMVWAHGIKMDILKDTGLIKQVLAHFITTYFSLKYLLNIALLVTLLLGIVALLVIRKKSLIEHFYFCLLVYGGYMLGLLGMYLTSIPISEALEIAGYERYHLTMVLILMGIVIYFFLTVY